MRRYAAAIMLVTSMFLEYLWSRLESVRHILVTIPYLKFMNRSQLLISSHSLHLCSFTRHRKKGYTISVCTLNPSRPANFLEIECFTLVACPEDGVIEVKV
ncbi:hypothetical protein H2248_002099 [Termitomyces sp. 'cryptogamus']|nr:hypothetical protein H2248_002099 [Termitomyces sp. 'cryptogamus']